MLDQTKCLKGSKVSPALPSLHGIWRSLEIMLIVTLRTKVEVTDQSRTYVSLDNSLPGFVSI